MAIKVQGTTVIDDSRNITANVICGNFCGGSINISISPRTCNVGFVSGTSQVVCADTFESVRLRSQEGLVVCVCNMPKGKPIFFDIGSTQGGTYCFRDSSNTSMATTCITVGQGQALIASLVQTPAFCGICCYYTEYSCAYQSWGVPSVSSGVYSRRAIFGTGCNESAINAWTSCDGNTWACGCQLCGVFKTFFTGCSCGSTVSCCNRLTFICRLGKGGFRHGLMTFADGRVLLKYAFQPNSMGEWDWCEDRYNLGGYAVFCNGSATPSLVACGNCWACCGNFPGCSGWCGCAGCYGCRGTVIGADTSLGYIYVLGTGTSAGAAPSTLNVLNLSCWPFTTTGIVQQIVFCGCVLCQSSTAKLAAYNIAQNTNSPWVSLVGLRCAYGFGNTFSWDAFKACKTGSSVCPLCFVISCNQQQCTITCYSGGNSNCYNYENPFQSWVCSSKFLVFHSSSSPFNSMVDAWCDVCPTGLCASWCVVQRWGCNCCMFTSVLDLTQSADGRFEAWSFCYGGPFQSGNGAGAAFWDCCRNCTVLVSNSVCTLLSVGHLEFHLCNSCAVTGPFCISGAGQFGWCYDGPTCNWLLVGCNSCSECVRYYPCINTCLPGSGGTHCSLCGGGSNGCGTCFCTTLPFLPEFDAVSSGTGYSFFNYSASPNNCCTCQR